MPRSPAPPHALDVSREQASCWTLMWTVPALWTAGATVGRCRQRRPVPPQTRAAPNLCRPQPVPPPPLPAGINRNRYIALMSAITLRDNPGETIVTDSCTSNGLAQFIASLGGRHFRCACSVSMVAEVPACDAGTRKPRCRPPPPSPARAACRYKKVRAIGSACAPCCSWRLPRLTLASLCRGTRTSSTSRLSSTTLACPAPWPWRRAGMARCEVRCTRLARVRPQRGEHPTCVRVRRELLSRRRGVLCAQGRD